MQKDMELNVAIIYGKVLNGESEKPIEGVSVQFFETRTDSITHKKREVNLVTLLTDKKGDFYADELPAINSLLLQISAIGYETQRTKIPLNADIQSKDSEASKAPNNIIKDLGNIKLKKLAKELDNVTVTANKPLLEMFLDKKIYNVEKDISTVGGTALDVVKNIPSVLVDIDGNVTMRNSTPHIFVDGRPTTLTLEQISADQIATIEIISNPSAKFDAGAGGAGILNIVLKKNRKWGYNGNLRANIDSRWQPGYGGDINLRQNKINFFASGLQNMRKNISTVTSRRADFLGVDTVSNILQANHPVIKGYLAYARAGLDYFLDNRSTFSITGNAFKGKFSINDLLDIYRDTVSSMSVVSETALRTSRADVLMQNAGIALGFKHNFPKEGREITVDINVNESRNTNTSNYNSKFYDSNGNSKPAGGAERATGGGNTKYYTFQTDYTHPFDNNIKFETGIRAAIRNYTSWNDNFIENTSTNIYMLVPALTVNYDFEDAVYAAYASYSRQIKSFGFNVGLRAESSRYKGRLVNKNEPFSTNYPLSLFPSVFLSQKINSRQDIQLNYSRKISRPNFFQLLPFVDFSDSLNLALGNPELIPEFTHIAELNYSNHYQPGHSVMATLYAKATKNLITRYQYRGPNTDPTKPDSVIYSSFANASKSYTAGIELTAKNKITKWWDLTTNFNFFDVILEAENITGVSNNELFSWFAKMNSSFRLPANYSVQLTGDYQAKTILPVNSGRGGGNGYSGGMYGQIQNIAQGYIKPLYGLDISIKKDFCKNNAASATLQFNDIFRTRAYRTHAETAFFNQDNYRIRDPQVLRLNLSWRFGKQDMALFKRKNMKTDSDSMQGMGQ